MRYWEGILQGLKCVFSIREGPGMTAFRGRADEKRLERLRRALLRSAEQFPAKSEERGGEVRGLLGDNYCWVDLYR